MSESGKKSEGWHTDHERALNETLDLGGSVASGSTMGTAQGPAERRRTALRAAREREGKDPMAQFDQEKLRERLQLSVPLQKLYERMYFDSWSPVEELAKYDKFQDDTVPAEDFERVIQAHVPSLDKEKNEVSQLTLVCPRIESDPFAGARSYGSFRTRSSEKNRQGRQSLHMQR